MDDNKLEINKYKKLIQEKEKKVQVIINDSNQKEECSSKNIATLKSQVNEKNYYCNQKTWKFQNLKIL